MGKRLTKEDILNARGVYRYMENTIFVELEDDIYCLNNGTGEWEKNEKLYEYLDSSLMMSYFSTITKEEVVSMFEE